MTEILKEHTRQMEGLDWHEVVKIVWEREVNGMVINQGAISKFLATEIMVWNHKTGSGSWRKPYENFYPFDSMAHAFFIVDMMRERIGSREEAKFSSKMANYDILSITPYSIALAAFYALAPLEQLQKMGVLEWAHEDDNG